ncbi:YfhO family protein [Faecalicatena orotica]|uniref:Putative membrane protein YfhO n=1 Tax=Faecalicatena orotica TaxID=1544 RepID=A0A2Y9C456_9FIRM|nr:YfhO family protein [Faecalicatena orotica]PWJ31978.1 putative membrane protein YfhO [Faecalicatena orotica]SSA53806.1 Uncharacterized membrane protein YfhO [Faecalicatena orotica]
MLKNRELHENRKKNLAVMGIIFICITGLFMIIHAVSGIYPFGTKSNMLWDQDIQYVDYFAFYQDVLLGKAHLGYSFSKSMGGSLMALFGYYLGCPLNLFVVFFPKALIPLFLFILNTVKLGLAGITMDFFLSRRFPVLSLRIRILLSVSYGLMQYVMIQSSNIMWLDGVILLPLLLWNVYRFVTDKKKTGLFITVLLSIAINWYTGYMTGIFAGCYFLYERILSMPESGEKGEWKKVIADTVRAGLVMLSGVLGSCFIFYPIVKGLQNGKEVFSLSIFAPAVNGSFLDIFRGFALGSVVPTVSLYCGLPALGLVLYYFISGRIPGKEKLLSGIAVIFMLVSCWFIPLECVWSGFRYAGSYRYRFSFVAVFLLIYLAARGAAEFAEGQEMKKMSAIYGGLLLLFIGFYFYNVYGQGYLKVTFVFLAIYCLLFLLAAYQKWVRYLLPVVLAVEFVINGAITFQINYQWNPENEAYQDYVNQSEAQIRSVQESEDSVFYRMDTLQKRYLEPNRCSAYLNEAMVYGYRGLNHYSSTYDSAVGDMLLDIGYSTERDLSIVSESVLPADSLFGVKYLLSAENVAGYEKVSSIPEANQKAVYRNPYVLGAGMLAAGSVYDKVESEDPFIYQNELFSNILGRKVDLYKKIEPEASLTDQSLNFHIPSAGTGDLLYGYIDTEMQDLALSIDGEYRCDYSTWLSYKIFNAGNGNEEHTITLDRYSGTEQDATSYFYHLDQSLFEDVIRELKSKEMTTEIFDDGHVKGNYTADEAGIMLLTIPYDDGWTARVNGEEVEIKQAANALMAVPVTEGANEIELKYHVPGVKTGILLTIAGVLLFLGLVWFDRRKKQE